MHCAIWYYLCNFKNGKSTHAGVLLLVTTKSNANSNTPPWVFLTFFKLQMVANRATHHKCSFTNSVLDQWVTITISFIIFWDFSVFYQIFLSPQVKRWAIITYKHGIYELPHELRNDLRLRIIVKALLILAENTWKTGTKLFRLCAIS